MYTAIEFTSMFLTQLKLRIGYCQSKSRQEAHKGQVKNEIEEVEIGHVAYPLPPQQAGDHRVQ